MSFNAKYNDDYTPLIEVRPSKYGKGVFSKGFIKKDEIVTFYPAHYVFIKNKINKLSSVFTELDEKHNDEYRLSLHTDDSSYDIAGSPSLYQNPLMLGHMLNDPIDLIPIEKGKEVDWLCRYAIESTLKSNCKFIYDKKHKMMSIVTTKDINKDEELLTSYGWKYWFIRTLRNQKVGEKKIKKIYNNSLDYFKTRDKKALLIKTILGDSPHSFEKMD